MTVDDGHSPGVGKPARWHRDVFILALGVVTLSFVFGVSDGGPVTVPATKTPVPSLCLFKNTTGTDCPGCGLTRCFIAMAHADWQTAYRCHPVGMAVFVFAVLQIPYHGMQWRRIARGRPRWSPPGTAILVWLLLAAMLVQWLLKITGLVVL